MTTHRLPHRTSAPQRQQGIALIMAIILLIIATLTGLAGMRNTSLQEKLSANLYDRAIAMQSAEFALSAAETCLFETGRPDDLNKEGGDKSSLVCKGGSITMTIINCTKDNAACPAVPANTFTTDATNWVSVALPSTFNKSLRAGNPQYFVQYLGLRNSDANTDTSQSANQLQEGNTGVGNDTLNVTQNATYRVTVRSSTPTADNDRAIVVLTSLVKSN